MPGTDLVVVSKSGSLALSQTVRKAIVRRRQPKVASGAKAGATVKKLSRLRKPEEMTLEAWQVDLRRQFGREQKFKVKNVGGQPVFSEFEVTNPQTKRTYRVAIRGSGLGDNHCTCPDFSVNTLGTCKHIEFTLGKLEHHRQTRRELATGFHPPYSEIYVRFGAKREIVFRPGADCPDALVRFAERYFDGQGCLLETAYDEFHTFLKRAVNSGHEVRCHDEALNMVAEVRDRSRLAEAIQRMFPAAFTARHSTACSRRNSIPISARGHCSPRGPGAACSPTTWALARPSRPSPPRRSSPAPSAWSGCWWSRPRR